MSDVSADLLKFSPVQLGNWHEVETTVMARFLNYHLHFNHLGFFIQPGDDANKCLYEIPGSAKRSLCSPVQMVETFLRLILEYCVYVKFPGFDPDFPFYKRWCDNLDLSSWDFALVDARPPCERRTDQSVLLILIFNQAQRSVSQSGLREFLTEHLVKQQVIPGEHLYTSAETILARACDQLQALWKTATAGKLTESGQKAASSIQSLTSRQLELLSQVKVTAAALAKDTWQLNVLHFDRKPA